MGESKKPPDALGYVTFRKGSSPIMVVENLPRDKASLELAIAKKFSMALATFLRRTVTILGKGDDPPDVDAMDGTRKIGIELVEIRNSANAETASARRKYQDEIRARIDAVKHELAGLEILLNDAYQYKPYPKWTTKSAERDKIVGMFVDGITSNLEKFKLLRPKEVSVFKWGPGPNGETVGAAVTRISEAKASSGFSIKFGGGLSESQQDIEGFLLDAIQAKCKKYKKWTSSLPLWLVAHETDFPRFENNESPCVVKAMAWLKEVKCPFEEIWYYWPAAGEMPGRLEKVWPFESGETGHVS